MAFRIAAHSPSVSGAFGSAARIRSAVISSGETEVRAVSVTVSTDESGFFSNSTSQKRFQLSPCRFSEYS